MLDEKHPLCVVCRSKFSLAEVIDDIISKAQISKENACIDCDQPISYHCKTCNEGYCDIHGQAHHQSKKTKDHDIVKLAETPQVQTETKASIGDDKLFCETCCILISLELDAARHNEHNIVGTSDASATMINEINTTISSGMLEINVFKRRLIETRTKYESAVADTIKSQEDKLTKRLDFIDKTIEIIKTGRNQLQKHFNQDKKKFTELEKKKAKVMGLDQDGHDVLAELFTRSENRLKRCLTNETISETTRFNEILKVKNVVSSCSTDIYKNMVMDAVPPEFKETPLELDDILSLILSKVDQKEEPQVDSAESESSLSCVKVTRLNNGQFKEIDEPTSFYHHKKLKYAFDLAFFTKGTLATLTTNEIIFLDLTDHIITSKPLSLTPTHISSRSNGGVWITYEKQGLVLGYDDKFNVMHEISSAQARFVSQARNDFVLVSNSSRVFKYEVRGYRCWSYDVNCCGTIACIDEATYIYTHLNTRSMMVGSCVNGSWIRKIDFSPACLKIVPQIGSPCVKICAKGQIYTYDCNFIRFLDRGADLTFMTQKQRNELTEEQEAYTGLVAAGHGMYLMPPDRTGRIFFYAQ